jgi:hypothetical protein
MKFWFTGKAIFDLAQIKRSFPREAPAIDLAHAQFEALVRHGAPASFLTQSSSRQPSCYAIDVAPLRFHVQASSGELWVLLVERI